MPRTLFLTEHGSDFEFDGQSCSVTRISAMLVDVWQQATDILQKKLLFGLSDRDLNISLDWDRIVDPLADDRLGQGFLANPDFSHEVDVMLAFMTKAEAFSGHFYSRVGSTIVFHPSKCQEYLDYIRQFKELIYVLLHWLSGMAKRGSEERLFKLCNTAERFRNIFWMLKRLAFVGNYSKTSALTGADRITLHGPPPALSDLILRFGSLIAGLEHFFVGVCHPGRNQMYKSYFYTSNGLLWPENRCTQILQATSKKHLGLSLGLAAIRQLMPAIAEHYELGIKSTAHSVLHFQEGHGAKIGGERYAIVHGTHPGLTSALVRDTFAFLDSWYALLGFSGSAPGKMNEEDMYNATFGKEVYVRESALVKEVKELRRLLLDSVSSGSNIPQARLSNLFQLQPPQDLSRRPVQSVFPKEADSDADLGEDDRSASHGDNSGDFGGVHGKLYI